MVSSECEYKGIFVSSKACEVYCRIEVVEPFLATLVLIPTYVLWHISGVSIYPCMSVLCMGILIQAV